MKAMTTKAVAVAVIVAATAFGVGCNVPVDGQRPSVGSGESAGNASGAGNQTGGNQASGNQASGNQAGGEGALKGVDASTQYAPEADPTKAQEIANRMWQVMTSQPCFYMTNSTYNYSFWGNLQYKYSGYETTSGTIRVSSVGKFGPYDMADVEIGSTQYWIGVADERTLVISFFYEGGLRSNAFIAPGPGGQCV